jgi:uncharacterized protein YndB with AHSA1/START domain
MTTETLTVVSRDIAAPIETVYTYRLDGLNIPEYNPTVANLRRVDGGTVLGVGADYRFDITLRGMGTFESMHRVAEAESPKRIVIETGNPPLMAREENFFTPAPGGGTHIEFRIMVSVPDEAIDGIPFIEQTSREQLTMEVDNIQRILESRASQ